MVEWTAYDWSNSFIPLLLIIKLCSLFHQRLIINNKAKEAEFIPDVPCPSSSQSKQKSYNRIRIMSERYEDNTD
jgi:hypothetical protein